MRKTLTSYGGLAYYPVHMYSLAKAILLVKRSAFFFFLREKKPHLVVSLEYQCVNMCYILPFT